MIWGYISVQSEVGLHKQEGTNNAEHYTGFGAT